MTRKLTPEQFLNKFYEKNKHAQDIELMEDYINRKTKMRCKCKKCGHEWEAFPGNLLNGAGCIKCSIIERTKTHEQFITDLHKMNSNIEILGTYINNRTKIQCRCKVCGYEWEVKPNDLLNGYGCPKCGGTAKLTHKEFIMRLHQVNPDIQVLGTYINNRTKIKCKCKIDGYIWEATPHNLLNDVGCPECAGNIKLTQEKFINKLQQVNPDIKVLGTYINNRTKIKCKCKKCEHIWRAIPDGLLRGSGCPKCNTSKGEKSVAQYLDNLGINYIYNKKYFNDLVGIGGRLLRPDFIIPSLKIWIEYDGEQHFKPVNFTGAMSEQQIQEQFKYIQENDQIKDQYAKDNNWILVRIPFTEYDNIEQILAEYIEQEEQVI